MKEKPEKVLLVITKSNFGGAQRYVYELALRLKKDGYNVAVALGGKGVLMQKLEAGDIKVFSLENAQRDINIFKEIKVLFNLVWIIKSFAPQIVHLNSPKIGGLGVVAAKIANLLNLFSKYGRENRLKKVVYTNHGWPFREPRPEWQLVIIRLLSWLTVFLNDKTIVLSQTEKDDVHTWPFIKNKLEIIPVGLSPFDLFNKEEALTELFDKKSAERLMSNNSKNDKKPIIVGTISELTKNKGLQYAIEGIASFKEHCPEVEIYFVIIGDGEDKQKLIQLISENKLDNFIFLAGHVDEARKYLNAFDVFLLSSVKEGLPFVILEAGFAGVPVISTSVGGIPEAIKNLETGLLIPPRRPQEIKNALIYLEEHKDIRRQMIKNFQNKIAEKYSFDSIVSKIEDLYKA